MSEAGKAWQDCYEKNLISWCNPESLTYEELERFSRSEWITCLVKALPEKKSELKILEAGCGLGLYAMSLRIRGYQEVEAFDYNAKAVKIAQSIKMNLQKQKRDISVRFFQDDLLKNQILSESYDFVFNQAVLEYFCKEEEKNKAMKEMVRVVKPGGKVAIIVQHTKHPFHNYWKMLGWPGYVDQPPVADWSPRILRKNLHDAGLTDIRISGLQPWKALFFWPEGYKKFRITHQIVYLIGRLLEKLPCPDQVRASFGIQLIGIGTKP